MNVLAPLFASLTPPRQVNVAPIVRDFAGISIPRRQAIARAAARISEAASDGPGCFVSRADFAVLCEFIAYARPDFDLAEIARRDSAVDQPHSPDESHFMDRERI